MEKKIYDNIYGYYSDLIYRINNNQSFNYISLNKGTNLEHLLFSDLFDNVKEIASGKHFQEIINILIFENISQQYNIPKDKIRNLLLDEISLLESGQKNRCIDYSTYLDEFLSRLRIFSQGVSQN
jgi:hypothetical protein